MIDRLPHGSTWVNLGDAKMRETPTTEEKLIRFVGIISKQAARQLGCIRNIQTAKQTVLTPRKIQSSRKTSSRKQLLTLQITKRITSTAWIFDLESIGSLPFLKASKTQFEKGDLPSVFISRPTELTFPETISRTKRNAVFIATCSLSFHFIWAKTKLQKRPE